MILDHREVLEFIRQPVDIHRLLREISFDADNFEQANLRQPKLAMMAGRLRTQAALDKAQLELLLETKQAELGVSLRRKASGDKRAPTDKSIANKVLLDPEVQRLRRQVMRAEAVETWAKQVAEVYHYQRLSVLKTMSEQRASEMANELRSVKEKAAMDTLRKASEKVRQRYDQTRE